jgi:type VI secretion system ImpM family protein
MSEEIKALDSSVFIFGKLPSQRDFVRHNASGPDVRSFDQWLQEGMYLAARRFDKEWDRLYKDACGYHFLFQNNQSLCGFLHPSFDQSERKYPFIISLKMNNDFLGTGEFSLLPLVLENKLKEFRSLVDLGINGLPIQELISQTETLGRMRHDSSELYRSDFNDFLESTTIESFWNRLFGSSSLQKSQIFIERLSQALDPFRSKKSVLMSYGLRFPLTETVSEHVYEICFWMSVCQSMINKTSFFPFMFWKNTSVYERNHVYIFLNRPPGQFFLHLFDPEIDNDSVYKLDIEGYYEEKDSGFEGHFEPHLEGKTRTGTLKDFLKGI